MNSTEDQYGFEAHFITVVPESLKCTVCHLVLRKPVQIMKCGHRFCETCFERIKGYAQHLNTALSCPVDREVVDVNKVFEDTGVARDVGNLEVKCSYFEKGCGWTGDLRNLKSHEDQCKSIPEKLEDGSTRQLLQIDFTLLTKLYERVDKIEETMLEKEKNNAFLMFNFNELKKQFNEKEAEMELIKCQNTNIKEEMKAIKSENQEIKKQFERENELLTLKNKLLENNVASLGNQLLECKRIFDVKQAHVETKVEETNQEFSLYKDKSEKLFETTELSNSTTNDTVMKLENEIKEELIGVKDQIKTLDDRKRKRNDGIDLITLQENVNKALENIDDIEYHVANIENVMFCNDVTGSSKISLEWKLQNYKYYSDLGEDTWSPNYFTQIDGYSFKIRLCWSGNEKEVGLWFQLCRANNYNKALEFFKYLVTFETIDSIGRKKSNTITMSDYNRFKDISFIIYPGENKPKEAVGWSTFLTKPDLANYIVNDTLTIRCILMPLQV